MLLQIQMHLSAQYVILLLIILNTVSAQQMLSPAPKIISLTATNPSTASGDISFYDNGCRMTVVFDLSTDTGEFYVKYLGIKSRFYILVAVKRNEPSFFGSWLRHNLIT